MPCSRTRSTTTNHHSSSWFLLVDMFVILPAVLVLRYGSCIMLEQQRQDVDILEDVLSIVAISWPLFVWKEIVTLDVMEKIAFLLVCELELNYTGRR
jgi:hypothetical protein